MHLQHRMERSELRHVRGRVLGRQLPGVSRVWRSRLVQRGFDRQRHMHLRGWMGGRELRHVRGRMGGRELRHVRGGLLGPELSDLPRVRPERSLQ
jgi:hypothetical protein